MIIGQETLRFVDGKHNDMDFQSVQMTDLEL